MQLLQGYAISSPHFIENKIINKQIFKKKKKSHTRKTPKTKYSSHNPVGFF